MDTPFIKIIVLYMIFVLLSYHVYVMVRALGEIRCMVDKVCDKLTSLGVIRTEKESLDLHRRTIFSMLKISLAWILFMPHVVQDAIHSISSYIDEVDTICSTDIDESARELVLKSVKLSRTK